MTWVARQAASGLSTLGELTRPLEAAAKAEDAAATDRCIAELQQLAQQGLEQLRAHAQALEDQPHQERVAQQGKPDRGTAARAPKAPGITYRRGHKHYQFNGCQRFIHKR